MSVYQNINGTLSRMDASDLVQLAATDTEGILGGTPGATTDGQTLVDQLAADDVQAQSDIGQIKTDLPNYLTIADEQVLGAWNLVENKAITTSDYGVTWTVNADKSVTANNTQTQSHAFVLNSAFTMATGRYFLSGCPSGGADNKYFLYIYNATDSINVNGRDYGNGVWVNLVAGKTYQLLIWTVAGVQYSNAVFKPMLALKEGLPYVPYAMTNRELTEAVKTNSISLTLNSTYMTGDPAVPPKLLVWGKTAVFRGKFTVDTAINPNVSMCSNLGLDILEDYITVSVVGGEKAYKAAARTNHASNAGLYAYDTIPTGTYFIVGTLILY